MDALARNQWTDCPGIRIRIVPSVKNFLMTEAAGVDAIISEGKESGGPPLLEEVRSVQESL